MNPLARRPLPAAQAPVPLSVVPSPQEPSDSQVREAFRVPERSSSGGLLLLGTLVLFTLSMMGSSSLEQLALLIPVLFYHEMGHWLGMRLSGFRDVKMFFVPFFGAAVSGRNQGGSGSDEALVLLLGPLPGIFLGLSLAIAAAAVKTPLLLKASELLLILNGFNLLPLLPLDGGRFFQLIIFGRHRYLENAFTLITSLAMIALALALKAWVLGAVALLRVVGLARQVRLLRQVHELRKLHPSLEPEPEQLDEGTIRALYQASSSVLGPKQGSPSTGLSKTRIETMKQLHQRVSQRSPSVLASFGLFGLWCSGVVVFLIGLVLVLRAHGPLTPRPGGARTSVSASASPSTPPSVSPSAAP